jgi:hypothetical protein
MSGSEMQTDQMICYCFNYRESDLLKDLERHDGRSIILQEIVAAKRRGACQCASKHPQRR